MILHRNWINLCLLDVKFLITNFAQQAMLYFILLFFVNLQIHLQHPTTWEPQVLSLQHEMSIPNFDLALTCSTWKNPQGLAWNSNYQSSIKSYRSTKLHKKIHFIWVSGDFLAKGQKIFFSHFYKSKALNKRSKWKFWQSSPEESLQSNC